MPSHESAVKRHKPLVEDFLKMYQKGGYKIKYIQQVVADKHGYEFGSVKIIINGNKADRILAEREKQNRLRQAS